MWYNTNTEEIETQCLGLKEVKTMNENNKKNISSAIKEYIYIPITLIIVYLVFGVVFRIAIVPTASMEPTYMAGSACLSYRLIEPEKLERGDIVLFRFTDDTLYVKRLIGLPGDEIVIDNGEVFVNNNKLDESDYLSASVITECGTSANYTVPENSFFFMGDNRTNSYDSRFWDEPFIGADKIYGKALWNVKLPGFLFS